MADLPQRPPLPPSLPSPSPLPTPPSSTTIIPPLCVPAPTSVAHVVEHPHHQDSRKKLLRDKLRGSVPVHQPHNSHPPDPYAAPDRLPTHAVDHPPLAECGEPSRPDPENDENGDDDHDDEHAPLFGRLDLRNVNPSFPLDDVTKPQFSDALDKFVAYQPSNIDVPPTLLVSRVRELLDHLDALVEQSTLRLTNKLFDALSHPKCLAMLLYLLSDISASSTPVIQDVRKSYRYPYLVTNILANGNNEIRESFLDSTHLVAQLLSFLDASVPLSSPDASTSNPVPAHTNSIIVGNVVQILIAYVETSTEPLLQVLENRPTFIPAVVNLLHYGSVPKLLTSIIPDRCVQDVETMDHCKVSFDLSLTKALSVLSTSTIYHHLSEAFVRAAQTIFSVTTNSDDALDQRDQYRAEQLAYNVTQVYSTLVKKTIRAVRINTQMSECRYLNVYATPATASTLSHILRVGTELFNETKGDHVSVLDLGLSLAIDIMKYVENDREQRVASVSGQPPPLDTSALEEELAPIIRSLMSVLIDTVSSGQKHARVRLKIMELFVECTRVLSEPMMAFIDKLKFGAVAFKVMLFNPRNSLMQHVISRGVESALISPSSNPTTVSHWLIRTKLVQKIMKTWETEDGDRKWEAPRDAQNMPFLSALVHMACCVQHYHAMQAIRSTEKKQDTSMPTLSEEVLERFEKFCSTSLSPILAQESSLCGPKPKRKPQMASGGLGRSFGVLPRSKRTGSNGAHLVRSPSAHRFGYVAPVSSLRSRFDEVFVEGEEEEFEAVGYSSLSSVFDADVSDTLG